MQRRGARSFHLAPARLLCAAIVFAVVQAVDSEAPHASIVFQVDSENVKDLAAPSIVRHSSTGKLIVAFDEHAYLLSETSTERLQVVASDDDGATFKYCTAIDGVMWASLFEFRSEIYLIGTQCGHGCFDTIAWRTEPERPNDVVITKMLDASCTKWVAPVRLTQGLTAHSHNTGVAITQSNIFFAFESVRDQSAAALTVGVTRCEPPLECVVKVTDSSHFVLSQRVKITPKEQGRPAVQMQVTGIRDAELTLAHCNGTSAQFSIEPGAEVRAPQPHAGVQYAQLDWHASGIYASRDADLLDPSSWRQVRPVASRLNCVDRNTLALVGFSGWWFTDGEGQWPHIMEGVPVAVPSADGRLEDVLVTYRVNNDRNCNVGSMVRFSMGEHGLVGQWDRAPSGLHTVPGASIAKLSVVRDAQLDVFWLVSHVVRDSHFKWQKQFRQRRWKVSPGATCMTDRTAQGLYVSKNAVDWIFVAPVAITEGPGFHFSYPFGLIDGEDLLVVTRSHMPGVTPPGKPRFNSHASSCIAMSRMRDFRSLVPPDVLQWLTRKMPWEGPKATKRKRRSTPAYTHLLRALRRPSRGARLRAPRQS